MHREFATGFRRTRPRRSYKHFGFFCLAHGTTVVNPYPCLACRGQGTVYDPDAPPCPVEGNKYRRTIRCTACGGSGRWAKEACRQAYREILKAYHEEKAEYDRLCGLRSQALKRLTKEEIRALRELGI